MNKHEGALSITCLAAPCRITPNDNERTNTPGSSLDTLAVGLMTFAGLVPLIRPFLADRKSDWPEGIALLGLFGGAAIARQGRAKSLFWLGNISLSYARSL